MWVCLDVWGYLSGACAWGFLQHVCGCVSEMCVYVECIKCLYGCVLECVMCVESV